MKALEFADVRSVEWSDTVEAIERCYELGWTDGLPVVPPTVARVEDFLPIREVIRTPRSPTR